MSTFTQIYYHLIYSTKHRTPALHADHREKLYAYIWGVLKGKDCHLYRIGGVEDHIHMLTSLHPAQDLAGLIRDIKSASTAWIKANGVFRGFAGWQDGYGAFTKSHGDKNTVIEYIRNQVERHRHESFRDELRRLLEEHGVPFDERFLD